MIQEYFRQFIISPFAGAGWTFLLVGFVGTMLILTAVFRRDVEPFEFADKDYMIFWDLKYFIFTLVQQLILVSSFFWIQKMGISKDVAVYVSALLFGVVGHFGNRGLMWACTALAFAYLPLWSNFHNLYLLWIGHFVLSRIYWRTSPGTFTEEMKVWRR